MVASDHFRNLSYGDLERVMNLCNELHRSDTQESFVTHCQQVMQDGFSNVHFSAERYQLKPFALVEQPMQTVEEKFFPLFYNHVTDHPYAKRMMSMASSEIGMTHSEPAVKQFRKSALYNEFYTEIQSQNQLWVGIREDNELLNCIYSRESEYTDNELAMMCIIQPHLESAWTNWRRQQELQQELGVLKEAIFQTPEEEARTASIRQTIDLLPNRQRDVIELVAMGRDNQQIADEMKISVLTVKKHLQLIFQALDVHHRTELAAKWHQGHSISIY